MKRCGAAKGGQGEGRSCGRRQNGWKDSHVGGERGGALKTNGKHKCKGGKIQQAGAAALVASRSQVPCMVSDENMQLSAGTGLQRGLGRSRALLSLLWPTANAMA